MNEENIPIEANEIFNTEESVISEDVEDAESNTENVLTENGEADKEYSDEIIDTDESSARIKELQSTINTLEEKLRELENMSAAQAKAFAELEDFNAFFPTVHVATIPDSVWDSVKKGVPLAAAYAFYQRKCELEAEKIAEINKSNASRSAGVAGKNTASEYFSPDDVRKMSHAEVHANYSKIKESMKTWI